MSGARSGALDVADEGIDLNAFAGRHGVVLQYLKSRSGKNRDIYDPYRGGASPVHPERQMVAARKNADFFANLKAQSWWALRMRFQAVHRAVVERKRFDPDAIISLSPHLEELPQLLLELSQPTYGINAAGKVVIDKSPPGCRSPNLADTVCIAFSPASMAARMAVWVKLGRVD